jgi:lysophospholipase L1-like esterase
MEPSDAHALPKLAVRDVRAKGFERTHHLMTRNDRRAPHIEIALDDVKVGPADAACVNFDQDFICRRFGDGNIGQSQRMRLNGRGGVEEHGSHEEGIIPSRALTVALALALMHPPIMWIWIPLLAIPVVGPAIVGWKIWDEIRRTISEDPLVWEKQIRAFEKKERKRPAPKGAVVFAGSSTIRLWGALARDMAPLPAVQRGFGGAKVNDVIHYMDRLITPHDPAIVVLYIGSNDLLDFGGNEPKSLEQMRILYDTLLTGLHDRLPGARIVVVATFPSPLNARRAEQIEAVNRHLREAAENKPWLELVDGNAALQSPNGKPERSLFRFDRVHLNKKGYARWAQVLRPKLLEYWRQQLH